MHLDAGIIGHRSRVFWPAMRRLSVWALPALCLWTLIVSGCAERDLTKPPKIGYGRDICAQCRMIIEDERFACAAVSADGRYLKFDDIGCMAANERENGQALRAWTRDAEGDGWIAKEKAVFVHSKDLVTPMGYGLAAFSTEGRAKKFCTEKAGGLIAWTALLNLTKGEVE